MQALIISGVLCGVCLLIVGIGWFCRELESFMKEND
jgi:isochorismate hydrolase